MSHPRDPGSARPASSPKARGADSPRASEGLGLWDPPTEGSDPSGSTEISLCVLGQKGQILPRPHAAHGAAAAILGGRFPASPLSL